MTDKIKNLILAVALSAGMAFSQALAPTAPFLSSTSAGLPATCSPGQVAFVTGATAGQNWFFCTGINTWTQQLNSGGGTGNKATIDTPTTGTSMTFAGSSSSAGTVDFIIPTTALGANVATSTCSGFTVGQKVTFIFTQDATGGRTVASCSGWDSFTLNPTASTVTTLAFSIDASGNGHLENSSNETPSILRLPTERALPSAPASGMALVPDSTGHMPRWIYTGGTIFQAEKELTSGSIRAAGGANSPDTIASAAQMQTAIGMPNCAADGSHALTNPSGTMGCTAISGGSSPVAPAGYGYISPLPNPGGDFTGALQTLVANTVYLMGFNVGVGATLTKGHLYVEAGVNSSTTYWGLYKGDCSALAVTGSASTPNAGVGYDVDYTVSSTPIAAGYYVLAIGSTAAINLQGIGIGTAATGIFNNSTHPEYGTISGGISGGLPATCTAMTAGGFNLIPAVIWDN